MVVKAKIGWASMSSTGHARGLVGLLQGVLVVRQAVLHAQTRPRVIVGWIHLRAEDGGIDGGQREDTHHEIDRLERREIERGAEKREVESPADVAPVTVAIVEVVRTFVGE